jgi:hypothetical protein
MSSYWTEDIITTVQRTYIKGAFTGKYHAQRREEWSQHHSELYDMHIYQVEIILEEIRKDGEGDFPEVQGLRHFNGTFGQPVNCYDTKSETYFQLNLDEPRIADPQLSKITKEGAEHLGTITGTIYGSVTKQVNEKVRLEHHIENIAPIASNDWTGWTRTSTHEFSYINEIRYRRDYYQHINGTYRWGTWYAVNEGWSFASFIRIVSGLFFGSFLLFFLFSISWPGLIILGFVLVLFFISRVRRSTFGSTLFSSVYGLLLLFYIGGIAISVFRSIINFYQVPTVTKVDKRDYTHTAPVKKSATADEWIIHHRVWTDLEGNQYEGSFRVLKSAYRKAVIEYGSLKSMSGLSDVYRTMTLADEPRLKGVYPLFDSLRKVDHLDSLKFANVLVSFIQDIPYSTVTDGSCSNTLSHNLSRPAFPANYDCIGNIPYDVQSPVEFMANLEGDCDTRTLFLFTLLNHYHYHVAILGSEAFRHSLLGLNLPYPGSAKMAGTERYVLWETTSKGFIAGHLSPEIDHMDYWDFNLINTPSS